MCFVLRIACAVGALATLAACVTVDPTVTGGATKASGNWRVEQTVDRVTGVPIATAILRTRQVANGNIPFAPPAEMQLGCFRGDPIVRLAFDFKVGSNRNSMLSYRFDEKPGQEDIEDIEARFLQDFRTIVIEDADAVTQFVRELATSQVLYMRIRSLNASRTSAEFKVEGAPGAIESAFSRCPVKGLTRTAETRR
jgi:hypothetical protein